jgi:hypothetical protein
MPRMGSQQSPLESVWPDNVNRERRLLREHPEWTISRHKPAGWPATAPTVFEATDGTVTLTSQDLGALLDLVERAMQDGDSEQ